MNGQMELVVGLVALNDGEVVGKTRLQKLAYLLDECGMQSGLEFEYYNFGPFTGELARETDFAVDAGLLAPETKPGFHEVPYTTYRTSEPAPPRLGGLTAEKAKQLLSAMRKYSALDLEIAATLAWFRDSSEDREVVNRLVRERKPIKATPERIMRGWTLLEELGLVRRISNAST